MMFEVMFENSSLNFSIAQSMLFLVGFLFILTCFPGFLKIQRTLISEFSRILASVYMMWSYHPGQNKIHYCLSSWIVEWVKLADFMIHILNIYVIRRWKAPMSARTFLRGLTSSGAINNEILRHWMHSILFLTRGLLVCQFLSIGFHFLTRLAMSDLDTITDKLERKATVGVIYIKS